MKQKSILKKLRNDLIKLERMERFSNYYKFKYYVLKGLLEAGIGLDYGLPFFLAGIGVFLVFPDNNKPFFVDLVRVNSSCESIDTSYGYHKDTYGFDFDKDDEALRYYSKWFVNDYDLYERDVTSYYVNDFDLSDLDTIFSMSKDDLDVNFVTKSVEKIQQIALSDADNIYFNDVISVVSVNEVPSVYMKRKEGIKRNFSTTLVYLYFCLSIGCIINFLKKRRITSGIANKLDDLDLKYDYVASENNEDLEKIKGMIKDNMSLLSNDVKIKKMHK